MYWMQHIYWMQHTHTASPTSKTDATYIATYSNAHTANTTSIVNIT